MKAQISKTASPISHQLIPARKMTKKPEAATRMEVPRSGWAAISRVGSSTITRAISTWLNLGGRECRLSQAATMMGMESFITSEGWNFMKPRSSQRWAPLPIWPNTSTAMSSSTTRVNRGTDQRA